MQTSYGVVLLVAGLLGVSFNKFRAARVIECTVISSEQQTHLCATGKVSRYYHRNRAITRGSQCEQIVD